MRVLLFAGYDTAASKHRPLPICFCLYTSFSYPDRAYTVAIPAYFLPRIPTLLSAVGPH